MNIKENEEQLDREKSVKVENNKIVIRKENIKIRQSIHRFEMATEKMIKMKIEKEYDCNWEIIRLR